MELILLRHAPAAGNAEGRFLGVTDVPLTPEGAALARLISLPPVERVYRSPLCRCAQTTAILWPDAPETVVEDLRETNFGIFEGKTHGELQDDPLYQKWLSASDSAPPGGESTAEAAARAIGALKWILRDAEGLSRIGIVTHGGVLLTWMWRFGTPLREYLYDWRCENCGGFRVLVREDPLRLEVRETI